VRYTSTMTSMRKIEMPSPTQSPLLCPLDPEPVEEILTALGGMPLGLALWCEPFREEFPSRVELARHYAPQGVVAFASARTQRRQQHRARFLQAGPTELPQLSPGVRDRRRHFLSTRQPGVARHHAGRDFLWP
jgi:hypothetical protein